VLVESFLAHNPGATFSVLVVSDSQRAQDAQLAAHAASEQFEVLAPTDAGIDQEELNRRATMYSTQELADSLKPLLLGELLSRGHESVIFLDADGRLYADIDPVADLTLSHSLVLCPLILDPHPLWTVDSPEQIIMRTGMMSAGLLGVTPAAMPFVSWWAQRTARRCVFDAQHGLMAAQTWLTLAGALFDHHVLRDRGCNVGGWNLQARDVEWVGDVPTIDGGPLRYFHFAASFDPERPELMTPVAHLARWWATLDDRPGAARLVREYAEQLIAHGYRQARATPPLYDAMPDGTPIEPWMRASYRAAILEAEQSGAAEPPNPFSHGAERFSGWLERRTLDRLERRSVAPEDPTGPEDIGLDELVSALIDGRQLLARVRELEGIRDDAVRWAEREAAELRSAVEVLAARDSTIDELTAELARARASMEGVWSSPSWRLTKPLRAVKALAARMRPGTSPTAGR